VKPPAAHVIVITEAAGTRTSIHAHIVAAAQDAATYTDRIGRVQGGLAHLPSGRKGHFSRLASVGPADTKMMVGCARESVREEVKEPLWLVMELVLPG
jgi:hypothetical protein